MKRKSVIAVFFLIFTLTHPSAALEPQVSPQEKGQLDYQKVLPELNAARRKQFESEMSKLKSAAADLESKLAGGPAKLDRKQAETEFRSLLRDPDFGKQDQQVEKFRARYADQFMQQASAAGVDLGGEPGRMASILGLPADRITPEAVRDNIRIRTVPPPQSEIAGTTTVQDVGPVEYREPYTGSAIDGSPENTTADSATGSIRINNRALFVGTSRTAAFIVQEVAIDSGVRHVRVDALVNNIDFITRANAALAGYASAEVLINLAVFDGPNRVGYRSISLDRSVAWLWGFSGRTDSLARLILSCEFDRVRPEEARTYVLMIEFEGWVGAGGIAGAAIDLRGNVRRFTVTSRA